MISGYILIADAHLDLAFNALFYRRDLTQPVSLLRERQGGKRSLASTHPDSLDHRIGPALRDPGTPTVSLPEMRKGKIGIALGTIVCRVDVPGALLDNTARSQAAAYAVGQSHLAYYQVLEREGEVSLIKNTADLDATVESWRNPSDKTPLGIILSMESADPILDPDQVQQWWDAGLRAVSLTHFGANSWGHGTGSEGGLYARAYPLLDALLQAGIVLDLTHTSDLSFRQIMDYWQGPVFASHAACRALAPGQRQLSDEMIKAIIQRNGVIGVAFCEPMLSSSKPLDVPLSERGKAVRSMSAAVEHVQHICELAGNCRHVAIGSDLDGGFGRELAPIDLDTIRDLQNFLSILRNHGFSEADTARIAHGNLLKLFQEAWGAPV